MPATKANYIVTYEGHSQVYATAKKDTALSSPPPPGCDLDGKTVFFIAYEPDNEQLAVYKIPKEEVMTAEIQEKKVKEVNEQQDEG